MNNVFTLRFISIILFYIFIFFISRARAISLVVVGGRNIERSLLLDN